MVGISKKSFNLADESDRGAVIVGQAKLDSLLAEALMHQLMGINPLAEKEIRAALGRGGYLSSFSRRVDMAYVLNVITKGIKDDLEKIRGLRNRFAHGTDEVDFLDKAIADVVESLNCVKPHKTKMNRYSLKDGHGLKDHEVRGKGLLKYHKAIFCLGILELEIMIRRKMVSRNSSHYLKMPEL